MEAVFAYITAPDLVTARQLGQTLVEERLAACVNILPHMEAIYYWEGAIENAQEVILIAKTKPELQDLLQRKILDLHPYECPCVVFLPIHAGNARYLEWITKETRHA